jgi:hypothetical protein
MLFPADGKFYLRPQIINVFRISAEETEHLLKLVMVRLIKRHILSDAVVADGTVRIKFAFVGHHGGAAVIGNSDIQVFSMDAFCVL